MEYSDRIAHLVLTKKLDKPKYRDKLYQLLYSSGYGEEQVVVIYAKLLQINQTCMVHPFGDACHGSAIGSHIVSKSQFKRSNLWYSYSSQTSHYDANSQVSAKSQGYCLFCTHCDQLFGYSNDPNIPAIDTPDMLALDSDRFTLLTAYRALALTAKKQAIQQVLRDPQASLNLMSSDILAVKEALTRNESVSKYRFFRVLPSGFTAPFIGVAILNTRPLEWASAFTVTKADRQYWVVQWHSLGDIAPQRDWVSKMLTSPVVYKTKPVLSLEDQR